VIYVVGHRNPDTDSISSAIGYARLRNACGDADVRPARAGELNAETTFVLRSFDVPVPQLLTDATGLQLILVDHNEVGQAIPHIERAEILEVWDHHRLGDLRPPKPIFFHTEPVGTTATLIGELYFARGVAPTRAVAGILLAAILSDTVLFRSPTASTKDRTVASRLTSLAGVDPTAFGQQMLEIKIASFEHELPPQIVRRDFKEFSLGGQRVGIAQVEVMHPDAISAHKPEILQEMRARRETLGLTAFILMITDVQRGASDLWFVGERAELVEQAFGRRLEDGTIHLPGIMSRKLQVVPRLVAASARVDEMHEAHAATA